MKNPTYNIKADKIARDELSDYKKEQEETKKHRRFMEDQQQKELSELRQFAKRMQEEEL